MIPLQTSTNLGILGGGLLLTLGVFCEVFALYIRQTYSGSSSAMGYIVLLWVGVIFIATGMVGLGGSFLAKRLLLAGGLLQLGVGAFGVYWFIDDYTSLISLIGLIGYGLLIIGGVLNVVNSFTA